MNCPSCKKDSLKPSFIEDGFRAHSCLLCKGNWILIEDFVAWMEKGDQTFSGSDSYVADDSKKALLCPVTGTIMQKYKIKSDSDHKLDYSPHVGGVWLDAGEWEYLKEHGLAAQINSILTDQWQKQLREEGTASNFVSLYKSKFGEDDYLKVKEIREWLENHPDKAELRRYLMAQNPYSV
ncbi:MAG: hypothetical protein C9355_00110 [Thalassolituus maritimus]|uniref:Zn-finger domain-containing nucleic acid-binding protein n=1 Tax=Thalassolituus maritimus TaxID=484498 RepID=A0A1N7LSV7_9GAMM|nr:zf-TFIIB domain-containing protein [Thalassolituus maritimus]TPD56059.1 MAG: hypothetical protein C9355_00110 [Thalassolituus maritimus]SIS76842.1 Zn-finger domain-containing nucleic acid-binding protein [Thalassolituus maritimus]